MEKNENMSFEFKEFNETNKANSSEKARAEFNKSRLLIAEGCSYSLDEYATRLNNNVLAVGGSGTGKTRTVVTPNLLRAAGSYIVSDPKGSLYKKYSEPLRQKGYRVISLDFTSPDKSARYNPLIGVKTTQDVIKLSEIIVNEKASIQGRADPFWDASTTLLLSAIVGYMLETDYKPKNFSSILNLVREGEREDEETKISMLSRRFKLLKATNPDSWACAQFDDVNQSPCKTYDCIRATLTAKFAKLDTVELQKMMSGNDVDFAEIGKEKTALFVTVSDTDRSMDVLANLFFTQAMQGLCGYADNECVDSRLPVPVRFILDDFATNCKIEEFPRMISSIRSRGISVMLLIQSEAQLKQIYGFDGKTIIANCDTYVYLGGNDVETARAVSERCNKPMNQILNMPVGSCWVFRRGEAPVFTKLLNPAEYTQER